MEMETGICFNEHKIFPRENLVLLFFLILNVYQCENHAETSFFFNDVVFT